MEHYGRHPEAELPPPAEISPQDIDDWREKIFQAWYSRPDVSPLTAVAEIMVENPVTEKERVFNLFCQAYLYAQRINVRKKRQTLKFLDERHSLEERRTFAVQDVAFQQAAARFVAEEKNPEITKVFWDDFADRLRQAGGSEFGVQAARRGILSLNAATGALRRHGFDVSWPSPEEDAYDKIDLHGEKDGEAYLFQLKCPAGNKEEDIRLVPADQWQTLYPEGGFLKDQEDKFTTFLATRDSLAAASKRPVRAFVVVVPDPLARGKGTNEAEIPPEE